MSKALHNLGNLDGIVRVAATMKAIEKSRQHTLHETNITHLDCSAKENPVKEISGHHDHFLSNMILIFRAAAIKLEHWCT
jgi:2-iminoacetate synthase ThiH